MGELIMPGIEKPAIRDDWDYDESVELVRPVLGRWKREAKDLILPELWQAHEHLDGRDGRNLPGLKGKDFTFSDYCNAIGFTRQTGRNWLIEAGLILGGAHVSNNNGNQENYTPGHIIDKVRDVLGQIDLDPASCEEAQGVVGAETYYAEEQDGLAQHWVGRVFLNPPYQMPLIREFTDKLLSSLDDIDAAILLTNNNTDTKWFRACAEAADVICLTTGRIHFYTPKIESTQPTNGQTFFYYGDDIAGFKYTFADIGVMAKVV